MKATLLYESVVNKFPSKIDISDGKPVLNSGFLFERFNDVCDHIIDENNQDPWLEVGCWSFSQVLWTNAVEILTSCNENKFVKAEAVELEEFNKAVLINLEDDSWKEERLKYIIDF